MIFSVSDIFVSLITNHQEPDLILKIFLTDQILRCTLMCTVKRKSSIHRKIIGYGKGESSICMPNCKLHAEFISLRGDERPKSV